MNEDIFWLAINTYHEARSEPTEGQLAVCHVVMNRAEKKQRSVKSVILQPFQFSWHNGNKFPPITEYSALQSCISIAEKAIQEHANGVNLSGADHYFAEYITPPEWSKGMEMVKKIGRHIFYKEA